MPYLIESSNIVPIAILILVVMKKFSNLLNKKIMLMGQNMKQFSLNMINNLVNTFWAIGTSVAATGVEFKQFKCLHNTLK
ncbi:hypothetical protein HX025_03890 [Myroides odoratimimus]|uniref:hypothetical protein n=2 Tax=Flavobacteriaceae TaxID=49546 RepID=UPI002577D38E|nr:hypothetical protein [Myroides odoratimimus]MDM1036018.1 hypothetical protein [Myroides odoratimimus]MDM1452486.1 hypothetical protein [Myroides odoratimimus]MDM1455795.1 hypothetical protein [Myroides odoratimimus]MDM1476211.1 hypothetical protein [Myroides odoratimimus]MDM1488737.1 hypothetical protein [Myroides odoratimimus]